VCVCAREGEQEGEQARARERECFDGAGGTWLLDEVLSC